MSSRYQEFQANIQRARDLVGLGQSIGNLTNGVVNSDDIFRAALVQGVSALDSYMHGIILDRSVQIILGNATPGKGDRKFGLSLNAVYSIAKADQISRPGLVRSHVAERLSLETMQRPADIKKVLAMVGIDQGWKRAFRSSAEEMTTNLGLTVSRRNRIVHQSDADPLSPGTPIKISDVDALESITTVEQVVSGINGLVSSAGR